MWEKQWLCVIHLDIFLTYLQVPFNLLLHTAINGKIWKNEKYDAWIAQMLVNRIVWEVNGGTYKIWFSIRSFKSTYFDMSWQENHRCKLLITFRCACPTEHAGSLEDLTETFNFDFFFFLFFFSFLPLVTFGYSSTPCKVFASQTGFTEDLCENMFWKVFHETHCLFFFIYLI